MPREKSSKQLDAEIAAALGAPIGKLPKAGKRKPKKSPYEIKTARLKALQGAMAAAEGDDAWEDTDLESLEGWVGSAVDDDMTAGEWQRTAMKHLQDQSVLPEHVGAPPPKVYAWNDAFISTYRMNIDDGMSHEDAIDSARQNAYDTVTLTAHEQAMTKNDPKLYKD